MSWIGVSLLMSLALGQTGEPELGPGKKTGKEEEAKCSAPYQFKHKNPTLQKNLEKAIKNAGWQRYVDKKLLAVSLVDLTQRGKRFYSGVNDDEMLYAASLPKIAILLAVLEAAEAGKLEWTHEYDVRLHEMIIASNNADASWGTDIVGLLAIEATLRDPRYCFYDDEYGGLWVGRAYRRGGASNRDPMHNISHGATARQVSRFYTMLDAGKLVSRHWSFRMLGLMSPPKHFHKFVGALTGKPGVVFLARKSGTWRNFHADSILVQHHSFRYILVGISEIKEGESLMRKLAGLADGIIEQGEHRKSKKRKGHVKKSKK